MNLEEERVPKLYGLGAFERLLVANINEAINSVLFGVPDEKQAEIIDLLSEGALVFDLQ